MGKQIGFRDVEHLVRPIVLAGIMLGLFLVVRAALVPDDFGVYGHYRAGALDDVRGQAVQFAGRDACTECHDDVVEARVGGAHDGVGCEACHGPLAAHADDPTEVAVERPDPERLCARCHAHSSYRPIDFPQVDIADHAMDEPCNACHEPHRPEL